MNGVPLCCITHRLISASTDYEFIKDRREAEIHKGYRDKENQNDRYDNARLLYNLAESRPGNFFEFGKYFLYLYPHSLEKVGFLVTFFLLVGLFGFDSLLFLFHFVNSLTPF